MSSADVWKYRDLVLDQWITKTVWQRILSRRARHRKASTTETVQSIARYDQLPLSGRTQMLTASDFCCECTTVNQVRRSSSMETSIHEHCELKSPTCQKKQLSDKPLMSSHNLLSFPASFNLDFLFTTCQNRLGGMQTRSSTRWLTEFGHDTI